MRTEYLMEMSDGLKFGFSQFATIDDPSLSLENTIKCFHIFIVHRFQKISPKNNLKIKYSILLKKKIYK